MVRHEGSSPDRARSWRMTTVPRAQYAPTGSSRQGTRPCGHVGLGASYVDTPSEAKVTTTAPRTDSSTCNRPKPCCLTWAAPPHAYPARYHFRWSARFRPCPSRSRASLAA
jgi:hypothetical protein